MDEQALADVARELLRQAPAAFIAERTKRARAARSADRELAAAIGRVRKPAVAAWIVNLLAADGALADAVELGPALRAAQASADVDAIRDLRVQRRTVVEALADRGAALASAAGVAVSASVREAVETTVGAAMADDRAGRAVASGLLLRPLDAVGFEPVDLTDALAAPSTVDLGAPVVALRRPRAAAARTDPPGRVRRPARASGARGDTPEHAGRPPRKSGARGDAPARSVQPADGSGERHDESSSVALRAAETDARRASRAADETLDRADAALDDADDRTRDLEARREELAGALASIDDALRQIAVEREELERQRDEAEERARAARSAFDRARSARRAARG
ncbi:hypothetical protein [Curtobacterium ammoniigenes]|uniref:hypothetical protein n=1 Tax=Curtobacterium ammoniigenes TaxID=395387 RepID=UPI000835B221|nr:hypothetical protein [Curtobacterium ammoniigenes]